MLKYLVSCVPHPTEDGWPGNPIGNLAKNDHPQDFLLTGKSYTYDYVYSDEFYSSLDIVDPILNADGTPLAFLCIDYAAAKEKNTLMLLKYSCFGIVFVSFLISIAGSVYISRKLSASLRQLTGTAERVAASDLDFALDIQSNDEFATLGHTFNRMVRSIRGYTKDLAEKHQQLTTVVEDMHDGVGDHDGYRSHNR